MNAKLVMALILIALTLLFIAQNMNVVDLRFVFWTLSMSRALLFIIILLVGTLVGWWLHGHSYKNKHIDK